MNEIHDRIRAFPKSLDDLDLLVLIVEYVLNLGAVL